jgi:hypothetical protein
VGGNDLSHAVPRGDGTPAAPVESVTRAKEEYASNLRAILAALRAASPTAPIRVLGLYDPFEQRGASSRLGASVILGWNGLMQETALSFPDALVVPTSTLRVPAGSRPSTTFTEPGRLRLDRRAVSPGSPVASGVLTR